MSIFSDESTLHHLIESKGPNSFWVHRYEGEPNSLAQRFSRIVFFSRNQQEAESYVRQAEANLR